jgi:hypothetical protein
MIVAILLASVQIVKLNTAHVAGFPDRVKWKRAPAGGCKHPSHFQPFEISVADEVREKRAYRVLGE